MKAHYQLNLLLALALLVNLLCAEDDQFFDNDFHDDFQELEDQSKFAEQLENGFKNWESRCKETGGEEVLRKWQKEQEDLIYCFLEEFDIDTIEQEMDDKKTSGDLDVVFKKYCGQPMTNLRRCLETFLQASHQCLKEEDRVGLNVTMSMVDAAIDFACHNSGDRMALFMAEAGMDCVEKHKDDMLTCLNRSVPSIFKDDGSSTRMHFYVFQKENCAKGEAIIRCVEDSLLHCQDPTPSNLVHGLLKAVKDVTPCAGTANHAASHFGVKSMLSLVVFITTLAMRDTLL
jgi:hypothetical protein